MGAEEGGPPRNACRMSLDGSTVADQRGAPVPGGRSPAGARVPGPDLDPGPGVLTRAVRPGAGRDRLSAPPLTPGVVSVSLRQMAITYQMSRSSSQDCSHLACPWSHRR